MLRTSMRDSLRVGRWLPAIAAAAAAGLAFGHDNDPKNNPEPPIYGDIVYGDCKRDGDCAPLYTAWADLFANGHFSRARAEIPMMGVLDDHDYGQVARRRDDCVIIRTNY